MYSRLPRSDRGRSRLRIEFQLHRSVATVDERDRHPTLSVRVFGSNNIYKQFKALQTIMIRST